MSLKSFVWCIKYILDKNMPGSQMSFFFCWREALITKVVTHWVIYDLCPQAPGSVQLVPDPNTHHRVSFSSLNTSTKRSCTCCRGWTRAHRPVLLRSSMKRAWGWFLGADAWGMWTRQAVSIAGAHSSSGNQEKQSRPIVGHVGGGEKSIPIHRWGRETRNPAGRCSFLKGGKV